MHKSPSPAELRPLPWRMRWGGALAVGLILLGGVIVYGNSFRGVFLFDDVSSILNNPSIQSLGRLDTVLRPPYRLGETVGGRPLLNLSLAVNYAISGTQIWSYHLVNLLLHLGNAWLLFALLRRTLQRPVVPQALRDNALPLALVIAGLWTVHPLHTEAVTYVVERAEALMAMFYLLTLYAVLRSDESVHARWWQGVAIVACLLGLTAKEVMVTAPVVVLLYDRTFLAGGFGEAWRRRGGLYVMLAATWVVLGGLLLSTGRIFQGVEVGVSSRWAYALTEPQALVRYIRLSLWPHPLCAYYAWPVSDSWREILPCLAIVTVCALVVAWALVRRPLGGFLGAWFFLILAPTSSFVPTLDVIVERRMYLPLVAVIGGLVFAGCTVGYAVVRWRWMPARVAVTLGTAIVVGLAATWGTLTIERNKAYSSQFLMWQDTVAKAPENARSHYNYALALGEMKRTAEAIEHYDLAIRCIEERPRQFDRAVKDHFCGQVAYKCGLALAELGRPEEAVARYEQAIRYQPELAVAYYNCGIVLADLGRTSEALVRYQQAVQVKPDYAEAHNNWGNALLKLGRTAEAIAHYRRSMEIDPARPTAHNNLATALLQAGSLTEAAEHFQRAVRLKPDYLKAHSNLVVTLVRMGRLQEALEAAHQADRMLPGQPQLQGLIARLSATGAPGQGGAPSGETIRTAHAHP